VGFLGCFGARCCHNKKCPNGESKRFARQHLLIKILKIMSELLEQYLGNFNGLHYEDSFKEMMVKFAIEYADEVSGNG
jgi:trehalose-6-phosphatase